jgi:cobalt-zinc-cadmium efflux system protein
MFDVVMSANHDEHGRARPHKHEEHEHDHRHGHAHRHGHTHGATTARAFAVGVALNLAFVVVGVIAGFWGHSMALIADAAHNFGDVLGLALAGAATRLARAKPSARRTYGLRRTTILASLANAMILLVGVGAVSQEAVRRLGHPPEVHAPVVLGVAALGVLVNGGSALLFLRGRREDLNVRGAFLHLAGDAAVSFGVVIAATVILFTGWGWVDPVASLGVSVVILAGTWSLLRDSLNLALDAVPENIEPEKVRGYLAGLGGVVEVHDLHIWAMSTTETALTAHLVMTKDACPPHFLRDVCRELDRAFHIDHATLQVETPDAPDPCALAPHDVV